MDPIVLCRGCGEYKHFTHFKVGERTCRDCNETEPEWLDSLARAVVKAEAKERERQEAIKAKVQSIMDGTKPPELTNSEWRMLHRIDRGETGWDTSELIGRVVAIAEKRLGGDQGGVVLDQPLDKEHGVGG